MSVVILRGDARSLPLPDDSVDLVVTSPPYYSLRDYRDGGESLHGQIGVEPSPGQYVDALLECTAEWARALKPAGSMFVVLGDKHANDAKWGGATSGKHVEGLHGQTGIGRAKLRTGFPPKSLMLLPHRYAIGCIDKLGLTVRAEIPWDKVNPLPDSTKDRVGRSHEMIFHLVKEPRYYSATDEVRQPQVRSWTPGRNGGRGGWDRGDHLNAGMADAAPNPLGRIPGSIWQIPTVPLIAPPALGVEHYAAYPPELVRRIILGWSPSGICTACGAGRFPVTAYTGDEGRHPGGGGTYRAMRPAGARDTNLADASMRARAIIGYACGCTPYSDHPERRRPTVTPGRVLRNDQDTREALGLARFHGNDWPTRQPIREYHFDRWQPAPTRPALVVDPFAGTGTTGLVADVLGRNAVLIDRSADYCRLATWRVSDPAERARALGVPKPPVETDGQLELFGGDAA